MAFDHALKPLAHRDAGHIYHLPYLENTGTDHATEFEIGQLIGRYAKFAQRMPGFDTGFGKMARSGLHNTAGTAFSECHLYAGVTVGFWRL